MDMFAKTLAVNSKIKQLNSQINDLKSVENKSTEEHYKAVKLEGIKTKILLLTKSNELDEVFMSICDRLTLLYNDLNDINNLIDEK